MGQRDDQLYGRIGCPIGVPSEAGAAFPDDVGCAG
jgi:hypothetical protein